MKLYIGEYAALHSEPCNKTQVLEVGDEGAVSQPFDVATRAVRIYADGPCVLTFGKGVKSTGALATPISPGGAEWFNVQPNHNAYAVVTGTSQGTSSFAQMLELLTDPQATQARCAELAKATEASTKAATEARAATAAASEARAALVVKQHDIETKTAALEALRAENAREGAALKAQADSLASAKRAHQDGVSADAGERATAQAAFERTVHDYKAQVTAKQAQLDGREAEVAAREHEMGARETALKAAEDDYADRMAQFENLTKRKRA